MKHFILLALVVTLFLGCAVLAFGWPVLIAFVILGACALSIEFPQWWHRREEKRMEERRKARPQA